MEVWLVNTEVLIPFYALQLQIDEAAFCLEVYWVLNQLLYESVPEQVQKEVCALYSTSPVKNKFFTAVAGSDCCRAKL